MGKKSRKKQARGGSEGKPGPNPGTPGSPPSTGGPLPVLFTLAAAFAAVWAWYLVGVHYDAIYAADGGACGDGGCKAVLLSDDAKLFGVLPVSIPAIPMYALLALLGLGSSLGRFSRERLATLATFCGLGGLLFGGWLLFKMIWFIDSICRFCLIMDGANLAVLFLGLLLHPRGMGAALRSLPSLVSRVRTPGPELALLPLVLAGSLGIHLATEQHDSPASPVASEESTPQVPSQTSVPTPASQPAASVPTKAPAPKTRRVVLQAEKATIPLDRSVPIRGPRKAPITIVLFEDFQCPYCKKLTGNIETLLEDPELKDEVRVAFMHFPMHKSCNDTELKKSLHKFACGAAAASVCAQEQGKFWEMHDLMFRNNSRLRGSHLRSYARQLDLDPAAFKACLANPETLRKVRRDTEIAAAAGVSGTPALFINGTKLVGAQPVEAIKAVIEVEKKGRDGRVLLDVELEGESLGDLGDAALTVTLTGNDGPFTIDAFEASIEDGRAVPKPGVPPATQVTWYEADAACRAAGKRLCTEEEWLLACSGERPIDEDGDGIFSRDLIQGRQHSYGEHYREGWCADSAKRGGASPPVTGNHPRCVSPEGVYDLEGVSKEWIGISPDKAAVKGGSFKSGQAARCGFYKDDLAPDTRNKTTGFRCCSGGNPDSLVAEDLFPGGKVGDSVRDFSGTTLEGKSYGTDQLRGHPFIMTFWATWCEPCRKELPALAKAYEKHRSEGLRIVGINVDRDSAKVAPFLAQNPLPFPVILDSNKEIMNQFQSRNGGVPLTFWVSRDGTISQRSTGYDPKQHRAFAENVKKLIDR